MPVETELPDELSAAVAASASVGDVHTSPPIMRTVIRPATGWQLVNARELWQYRELLYFLTLRDVKVRYKQTVLGATWAILQPLLMMIVFSVFFGRLAHVDSGGWPYPLFTFTGLLPWTFFATAIANAGNSVVGSERLITKIYFPRLAIPFASVGAALVDFAVAFGMLFVLMLYYHVAPTWNLLMVPGVVLLFLLAALGVGTLLAALNVAYRDFRYVIPFLVQLWMFATPTVYMQPGEEIRRQESGVRTVRNAPGGVPSARRAGGVSSLIPASADGTSDGQNESVSPMASAPADADSISRREMAAARTAEQSDQSGVNRYPVPTWIKTLLNLNPMTGLIAFFRAAVLGGPLPWRSLAWSSLGSAMAFLLGCLYFRRVEDSFADII
jgi:homopolymeric O-antigen transport system permease protein